MTLSNTKMVETQMCLLLLSSEYTALHMVNQRAHEKNRSLEFFQMFNLFKSGEIVIRSFQIMGHSTKYKEPTS